MVDKIFGKVFVAMDNSKAVQQVTNLLGVQEQHATQGQSSDKTLCIIHKLKKTFFCEECCFELCTTCKEKHEVGHPIKFIEETAQYVVDQFKDCLDEMNQFQTKLGEAVHDDPTQYEVPEGQINILEVGSKEIDTMFEKIHGVLEDCKKEMKQKLKEAYILQYKSTFEQKSLAFVNNIEKMEKYVNDCLQDFDKRIKKGKFVVVCAQRPKVDELHVKLDKFQKAFDKLCETSREFKADYSLSFKMEGFEDDLKEALNQHINVTFPHLGNGFFKVAKKSYNKMIASSFKAETEEQKNQLLNPAPFDPIKSLENEYYDIRRAKEFKQKQAENQIINELTKQKPVPIGDQRYEIKTLKFKKDKFEVKSYDA